jgi:hypothetical protein
MHKVNWCHPEHESSSLFSEVEMIRMSKLRNLINIYNKAFIIILYIVILFKI